MYNGYGASNMNSASNYSMRDANGNLTMVNGQVDLRPPIPPTPAPSPPMPAELARAVQQTYGQATAIGNSLNVTVVGSHNTTIIDSSQINTGNQTATADSELALSP